MAAKTKNTHLEHIEDMVLNNGVKGLEESFKVLIGIRNMLSGHSTVPFNITTKWDGAPAIFCGTNPDTDRFFVGTKSVFNKLEPKINYSESDIDYYHAGQTELSDKLKSAFRALSKFNIPNVIQGDMLFANDSYKKTITIDGQKYISFKPNTITYAIPYDTKLAKRVIRAKFGVVFHTVYSGNTMSEMRPSFNIDVDYMKSDPKVWVTDAYMRDLSGTCTLTTTELSVVNKSLSDAGKMFNKMPGEFLNYLKSNINLQTQIKAYNNSVIRRGENLGNPAKEVREMIDFIAPKLPKRDHTIINWVVTNQKYFETLYTTTKLLVDVKLVLVEKLSKVEGIQQFLFDGTNYNVTAPEGFVVSDRLTNGVYKLVDRLTFSRANFTVPKTWNQ